MDWRRSTTFSRLPAGEKTTQTGDRVELDGLPENSPLWAKLDARSDACLGQTCPDYERCFITEMRRRAAESDVIIVNHHLFFADLAIKQQAKAAPDAGVLPEAAAVIFDEAHELEDVASSYFGISLSNVRLEELVRDMENVLRARGASSTGLKSCGDTLRERSRMFFAALPRGTAQGDGRMPFEQREQFLEQHGDLYLSVMNTLHRMEGELERLRGVEEAMGLRKRVADIREHLRFLLEAENRNTVFWIERRGGSMRQGRNTYLQATPIDVSSLLSELLFEQFPSVILTSATLTVQEGFEHLRKRLGLRDARELVVPSHFCYPEQALLYLPPEMPDPRDPAFQEQAARRMRRVQHARPHFGGEFVRRADQAVAILIEEREAHVISILEALEHLIPLLRRRGVEFADDEIAHRVDAVTGAGGEDPVGIEMKLGVGEQAHHPDQKRQIQKEPEQNLGWQGQAREHDWARLLRRGIDQHVPDRADGANKARILRIVAQFAAQRPDVDVDRAVQAIVLPVSEQVDEMLAGFHPAAGARQAFQEIELEGGQLDGLIIEQGDAPRRVDSQRTHHQLAAVGLHAMVLPPATPGDGANAREEFAGRERLGQVIVGAHFEADDAVGFLAARGEHEDRHVGTVPDALEHLEAIHLRQHDIEDHRLKRLGQGSLGAGGSGVLRHDFVAQGHQVIGD